MDFQTKSNPADEQNRVNYPNNYNLIWDLLGELDAFINEGLAAEGGKRGLNTQGEWLDTIETRGGH